MRKPEGIAKGGLSRGRSFREDMSFRRSVSLLSSSGRVGRVRRRKQEREKSC